MTEEQKFKEFSDKYGTPAFVYDMDELLLRVSGIKDILKKETGEGTKLCFSVKANPFLIPFLFNEENEASPVDRFEVCSPGELALCKHFGVPGEMIIYSGVNKEEEDIKEAIDQDVFVLTAESIKHYELIKRVCAYSKKKVRLLLRLTAGSQFGMSLEDLKYCIMDARGHSDIEITGIHYFAGTQRTKLKHQREELEMLSGLIASLKAENGGMTFGLEYGPGLSVPYFTGDDFSDTLRPLKELSPDLLKLSEMTELSIEMGRFICAECGYYLTKVSDLKSVGEKNWCILDGGINHVNYLGQMMGMKVPVIKHIHMDEEECYKGLFPDLNTDGKILEWTLCGSLCTTNDVLVRSVELSDLRLRDLLVFCNIGAYSATEAMNLFLIRKMPVVIAYSGGKERIVRDFTETWKLVTP